jgi:hypothetical protein
MAGTRPVSFDIGSIRSLTSGLRVHRLCGFPLQSNIVNSKRNVHPFCTLVAPH